ncbi:AGAP004792-PB-like protein [Anopheles sinensis]|uniref:Phosphatidylcholine transfer protein n=1 Tax=Anopheles sinensis TaxID=74873 RepID=A0A084W9Q8_ANOSI|nr:AGAP004792-PB-like protein [Anopheles sinensis]
MAMKLFPNSSLALRNFNKYLRKNVKDQSASILRLWATQCEFLFAQQLRRSQQIFAHYAKIWEERALRELLRRVRGQVQRQAKGFIVSSAALLSFDWERERIELDSVQEHLDDFQFLERLQTETIFCKQCEKRRLFDSRVDGISYCSCPRNVTEMLSVEQNAYTAWEPYIEQERMITWRRMYVEYPDVTAEDFLHVQIDVEYRKKWDNTAVNLEVIDEDSAKGSNSHVIYWEALWPKLFANRDYVYNRRFFVDRNRRVIMIVNKSVEHPKCPAKAHTQRVHEYWSYMVIKPTTSFNKPGVSFVLTYFDNPGLSIPKYITTWVAKKQMPDFLQQLHQATVNYAKAKKQNETRIIQFWDKHKDPGFEYPPDTLLGYSAEDFTEAQKQEEESSLQQANNNPSVGSTNAALETVPGGAKSKLSQQLFTDTQSKPSEPTTEPTDCPPEECTPKKKSSWWSYLYSYIYFV